MALFTIKSLYAHHISVLCSSYLLKHEMYNFSQLEYNTITYLYSKLEFD